MTGSTHVIKGIQPGVPVYVQVRPYMGSYGNPTAVGPWASLTARSVPTAPTNFWVDQYLIYSGGKYYFTHEGDWRTAQYASGYEVYQSKNLGKSYSKEMNISGGNIWFYIYCLLKPMADVCTHDICTRFVLM